MTEDDWIPVDKFTLKTRFSGVYAVGDVNSVGTPKAGVFSEGAAKAAAASIIAKVTRDGIMARLAAAHPGYGWERNAGYGTAEHRAALDRLGVTPHHRRSFKPVARRLAECGP